MPLLGSLYLNHVTGGHAQGDKACLYTHFGGEKALFSCINLQVKDSVGGQNHANFFHLKDNAPCLLQVRACSIIALLHIPNALEKLHKAARSS